MSDDVRGTDWSNGEVDLIVADYFAMLEEELAGRPYVKTAHNRALQKLTGRVHGSIERKHQNISAILRRLGMPWIKGYKPLPNFQNALVDGIGRYLSLKGDPALNLIPAKTPFLADPADLWIGPPPSPSPEDGKETDRLRRLVRRFDPAARDARNRALGKQGEEFILKHEWHRLTRGGRKDLASKIQWTSDLLGDGAGYDIHSFELNGSDRLIEVKTTNGSALTPFFLSENERAFSDERPDAFRLLRLYNFVKKPLAFELAPPLHERLKLSPTNYRASF